MATGKFSQPRPNREEEREIEQAFRQVTGQEAAPQPPKQVYDDIDPNEFDLIFDEEALLQERLPETPAEEEPADFVDKAMAFFNKAVDFCSENKRIVMVGLCALALVLILLFIGIFFISTSDPYDKTILNNVLIADVNVGGMTKDEAISAVKQSVAFNSTDMVVDLAGTELRLSPSDTKVTLDVKSAVNAAYDYGRTGTKAEQEKAYQDSLTGNHIIGLLPYLEMNEEYILEVLNGYAENAGSTLTQASYGLEGGLPDLDTEDFDPDAPGQTLVLTMGTPGINFDAEAVYEKILDAYSLHIFLVTIEDVDTVSEPDPVDLEAIYEEFYVAPVNATVDLRTFEVIPGTYGYGFDIEAAQQLVDKAEYGEEIRIPMEYIAPKILDEDMFFQDVLAEYKNSYKGTALETNLQLACEAINGTVLNPGEEFSFNNVVGERTSAKGYKYAPDVTGLEETNLLGGGISQVSSVLYYCTLVADLNVTSRTSHKLIPGYSDYGMDAMVGWRTPDFKFTNNTSFPIRIEAEASNGQLKMAIIGTDERDYYAAMDYEIISTKAPQREKKEFKADNKEGYKDGDVIQEGVTGYSVKTYRLKYDSATGELISRDFVATTNYQSVNEIVAVVEEPEEPKETTEATEPTEETEEPEEESKPKDEDEDDSEDQEEPVTPPPSGESTPPSSEPSTPVETSAKETEPEETTTETESSTVQEDSGDTQEEVSDTEENSPADASGTE